MTELAHTIERAHQSIRKRTTAKIDAAVVLGSGLSNLDLSGYKELHTIRYADIEGLPVSTAPSHAGELRIVSNNKQTIALCAGRHHLYEGYTAQQVCTLTYLLSTLGAQTLIITNAAGALNAEFTPGDVMLIDDHINATNHNPLIGQDETLGNRFPDMSEAYSNSLLAQAQLAASSQGIDCHHGVYIGVTGPSLETSAERRMFSAMGADAVGMSTVLEVIAANHCGMNVLGLSAITNLALGDDDQSVDTLEDVLRNAAIAGEKITTILNELLT